MPVFLSTTFSDGPDNMSLTVNGQNTTSFSAGSNLTMLCSAQSNPPAQLQWAVRGELVNTTGQLLELSGVSEDQSGPYSCLAFNNHTNMNSNITKHVTIASEFVCIVTSTSIFFHLFSVSTLLCLYRVVRIWTTGCQSVAPAPAVIVGIPLLTARHVVE